MEKVKEQQDIREIYQELSYDDLSGVLNEWLNPSEEDDTESNDKEEKDTVTSSELESSKVKDTSEAFDELFNS